MKPAVELDGAGRVYYSGTQRIEALRPTRLKIYSGDLLAVTGPSGSGKSTLLNLVGLLVRPSVGSVRIDGTDTDGMSDRRVSMLRGESLGFVFQSFHLLSNRSVRGNLELPLIYGRVRRSERRARVTAALAAVGLSDRSASFPGELSGGERQRVAIARALIRQPRLVLCDEPTGNLDSAASTRVIDLLLELNRSGIGIAIVTHNPEVAAHAQRQIVIGDGWATES